MEAYRKRFKKTFPTGLLIYISHPLLSSDDLSNWERGFDYIYEIRQFTNTPYMLSTHSSIYPYYINNRLLSYDGTSSPERIVRRQEFASLSDDELLAKRIKDMSFCDGVLFCGDWEKDSNCVAEHNYCVEKDIPFEIMESKDPRFIRSLVNKITGKFTAGELLSHMLISLKFEGLVNPVAGCGCAVNDLAPCGNINLGECYPAFKEKCKGEIGSVCEICKLNIDNKDQYHFTRELK